MKINFNKYLIYICKIEENIRASVAMGDAGEGRAGLAFSSGSVQDESGIALFAETRFVTGFVFFQIAVSQPSFVWLYYY